MLSRLDDLAQLIGLIFLCVAAFLWNTIVGFAALGVAWLIVGESLAGVRIHWTVVGRLVAGRLHRRRP